MKAYLQCLCKQAVLKNMLQLVCGSVWHWVHQDGFPFDCSLLVAHHSGCC